MGRTRIFYGWWIVLACFGIALYVAGSIFFGFTAFVEPIVREFGWSYTRISLVASLRGLNMGIFAPLAGILVDRYGSRRLIVFGMTTVAAGLILLGFTSSFIWYFCCFILISMGAGGCTSVVLMTVVATWFRRRVGMAMGLVACGFGAGGVLVPLNVWLVDAYSWRTAVIVLGLGMLVLGLPLSMVIRNRPEDYGMRPDNDPPAVDGLTEAAIPDGPEFKTALRNRLYWTLNASEIVRMMVVTAVVMHVMPYLGSLGMDRVKAGLVAAGIPLISIVGRLGFGWLGDLVSKQKVMAAALLCTALGMLAFSHAQQTWLIIPFLLFFAPGFGGNTSLRGAVIRDLFGVRFFGKLLGITMGLSSLGGIVGPALAGYSYDQLGEYQIMWLIFTAALFACGMLMLAVRADGRAIVQDKENGYGKT